MSLPRQAAVAAVLIALALLARQPILTAVARFMIVATPIAPADAILPTYQDPVPVARQAAEWFRRGYGKQIILYRRRRLRVEKLGLSPPAEQTMRGMLEALGVPPDRIVEFGHEVQSARDLVAAMAALFGTQSRTRVLVLESAPRSRVTLADLQKAADGQPFDFSMDALTGARFSETTWWHSREGVLTYFDSYTLWLVRFLR